MAQLKSTTVQGSLRVTDTTYTTDLVISGSKTARYALIAPTSAGAPTWRALTNADVGLGNVENTKLSTWAGTSNITTLGTVTTGTWSASTIAVNKGGTGATTFTSGALLIGNGTDAVSTRTIKNMTALGDLGWTATETDIYIPTVNTLAYWNGRFNSSSSNLTYCNKGAFGNAAIYEVDDATANEALSTGTGLTTERSVYYGLVTVNNASQTRATGIYAPTSAGTANQILVSAGGTSAPTWKATAKGAAYATSANGELTFGTLPIAQGGTGITTTDAHKVLIGPSSGTTAAAPTWRTIIADDLPTATTSAYGVTKLSNTSSSTEEGLAATPKGVWAAINTLDGNLNSTTPGAGKTLTAFSQTNGKVSATFGNISITASQAGLGNVTNDAQVKASLGTAQGDMLYWSAASTPARLAKGSANTILTASGTNQNPAWTGTAATITSATSTTANTAAYANLTLGNSTNVTSTTAHSEGQIILYSAATAAHTLKGASTTTAYTSTLPNNTGTLVSLSGGTAKGSTTKPIYVPNTGIVTECSTYAGGTKVTLNGTDKGASDASFYAPTSVGTSGQYLKSSGSGAPTWDDPKVSISADVTTNGQYAIPFVTTGNSGTSPTAAKIEGLQKNTTKLYFNPKTGRLTATTVANAIWNDYAECRSALVEEPGRVITENKDGKMRLTEERLMPACKIISDTYGTIMGQSKEAKTPIAVAGRVLAYPYQNREVYELGAAVCSAPNGTVDIMTRDEIREYPERILGTVSEIPNYDIWFAGDENNPKHIPINGRIWIYVR